MPDEPLGTTGDSTSTGAPASGSSGAAGGGGSPPATSSAGLAGPADTGGGGSAAHTAPATAPASTAAPQYQPVHEALKSYGFQLPAGLEGHAALQYVVQQAQRASGLEQLAQHGRQYIQHADQFQGWLKQQEAAKQAEAARKESWFKAPEWDPTWRQKISQDPTTGELKVAPGQDPSIINKYIAAMEHRQQFMDKFAIDPIGAIRPGIEEVVRSLASELIQNSVGQQSNLQGAMSFLGQNKDWLCAQDPEGRLAWDPQSGKPTALSPMGIRFYQHLQEAAQSGIRDPLKQNQYALTCTRNEVLMGMYQQQQAQQGQQTQQQAAAQQGQDKREQFLQNAAGATNQPGRGATLSGGAGSPAQNPRLNIFEALKQKVKSAGITDEMVNSSLAGAR